MCFKFFGIFAKDVSVGCKSKGKDKQSAPGNYKCKKANAVELQGVHKCWEAVYNFDWSISKGLSKRNGSVNCRIKAFLKHIDDWNRCDYPQNNVD